MLRARDPQVDVVARFAPLAQTLGLIIMIFGLSILFPAILSHALDDGAQVAYDEALIFTFGVGAILWLLSRRHVGELQVRDGFLLVASRGRCCRPSRR